jgi:hypothetical protein
MKFWILSIIMISGKTEYGYKFVEKTTCEKIGKQLVKLVKKGTFVCRIKYFDT